MRITVVLVPTRNQSWNVGSVARPVTLEGIVVVVKRTTQMLVVRERGLRTSHKTKVDSITWWIDSGATTHVCKERCWFKIYEPVEDGFVLYIGDDHFAPIHGKGSVALEFISRKTITLFNMLYVPKLRKNLVSGPMLNNCRYKQVYESDKYILLKSGVFVGFRYYNNGIIHETTAPYTPQQNGVAERKNRAFKEMVNSMLSYSGLSEGFWGEAMLTACYLLNRGCRIVVRLSDAKRKTLGEKGIDCIFFRHAENSKAYRPKDLIPNSVESQKDDHSDDAPNDIPEPHKEGRYNFSIDSSKYD
nr:zinc finger, CCHC-type [Tanacetum cinerariifolium]